MLNREQKRLRLKKEKANSSKTILISKIKTLLEEINAISTKEDAGKKYVNNLSNEELFKISKSKLIKTKDSLFRIKFALLSDMKGIKNEDKS